MDDTLDVLMDFLECAVHTILYARQIYPSHLFEQRMKYGISVWQCKHADVCTYVRRVLINSRTLLEQGLLDRLILTTLDQSLNSSSNDAINNNKNTTAKSSSIKNTSYGDNDRSNNLSDNNSSNNSYPTASSIQQNRVIDQISINVRTNIKAKESVASEDNSLFYHVEDELRSSILQLSLLDVNMDRLPNSATWTLMLTTSDKPEQHQIDALQTMLLSGEWAVENSLHPEKIAQSKKNLGSENSSVSQSPRSQLSGLDGKEEKSVNENKRKTPKIIPIKSFDSALFAFNMFAHSF